MIVLADISLATPFGALLALGVVPVIVASLISARRNARGRTLLQLPPPTSGQRVTLVAVAAVPLLLGAAAAGPVLRTHVGRRVRTDAQAIFVFDTSRSMAASAAFGAPTRFSQAQAAAINLRQAIPEVPSGVASFTTILIPHLFPTPNEAVFNSTVEEAIGVEKPPPPFFQFGVSGTSFGPLATLRNQGFFDPATKRRFAVVLTDGESGPFDPNALSQALTVAQQVATLPGRPIPAVVAPVSLLVVRVGTGADRIYHGPGKIEAAYRPNVRAAEDAAALASATHGHAYDIAQLAAAGVGLKQLVGSGRSSLQGVKTKTMALAPYLVLLALLPLGVVVRRRNLTAI